VGTKSVSDTEQQNYAEQHNEEGKEAAGIQYAKQNEMMTEKGGAKIEHWENIRLKFNYTHSISHTRARGRKMVAGHSGRAV
jgi:hypothetical protein